MFQQLHSCDQFSVTKTKILGEELQIYILLDMEKEFQADLKGNKKHRWVSKDFFPQGKLM